MSSEEMGILGGRIASKREGEERKREGEEGKREGEGGILLGGGIASKREGEQGAGFFSHNLFCLTKVVNNENCLSLQLRIHCT